MGSQLAHADNDYLVYEDERYTYSEVHAQVRKLAVHLVANGVHPGSRVAIAMRNYAEWIVSYWATVSVGAVAVGINAWWTAPELEYAFNDSEPVVLIADDERLERLNHMPEQRPMHIIAVRSDRVVPGGSTPWADVMAMADPGSLPDVTIDPDDDVTIFYTSGTTGFPKGAQLTHRGSVDNIFNIIVLGLATTMAEQKAIAAGESDDHPLARASTTSPDGANSPVPRDGMQLRDARWHHRRRKVGADAQVGPWPRTRARLNARVSPTFPACRR